MMVVVASLPLVVLLYYYLEVQASFLEHFDQVALALNLRILALALNLRILKEVHYIPMEVHCIPMEVRYIPMEVHCIPMEVHWEVRLG
jgi:hypothetical protein